MSKYAILSSLCSITCAAQISSTTTIVPGDPSVSGNRFADYENVWLMTDVDQTGTITATGTWYDTVRVDRKKGTLVRRQTVNYRNGVVRKHYDKADLKTMSPIHVTISQVNTDATAHVVADIAYAGNSLSGVRRFNVEGANDALPPWSAKFSMELPEPVFDWHLWGILVAGFPLHANYTAAFKAHTSTGTTNSPFLWITLKVVGSEFVKSTRWGNTECWKVLVNAEVPWTFWIAKTAGVAPIQMISIDQTAFSGPVSWWKPEGR